jgi:Cys-rich protein (TIGR01571 family)
MLTGLLLLGFAAVVVVVQTTPLGDSLFASAEARELQGFGYITTSRAPSSFDSSDSSSSGSSFEPSKSLESGSLESSDWQHLWPEIARSIGSSFGSMTASLILQICFGILYFKLVVEELTDDDGGRDLSGSKGFPGFFNCFSDPMVCCLGLCCPMVRVAHTNQVAGVCNFWETIACYCCCAWTTLNIGPLCLLMWWRARLKGMMGLEDSVAEDFFGTCLCPQVSICQMSSGLDNAAGYRMKTPVSIEYYGLGQE